MADKHPSGNPELVDQHTKVQRKGDRELTQGNSDPGRAEPERLPGRGKPDEQEGVGTVQKQKR